MNRRKRLDPKAPFTRKQALRAGMTDRDLRGPAYTQLYWGVYVAATVQVTLVVRALAALMVCPKGSVVSHHTAARLWGGAPPDSGEVHVTVRADVRQKTRGIRPHRVKALPPPVTRHGLRTTSPEQTWLDMAECCDLVQLVTLGDSLVRVGATTPARLVAAVPDGDGHRLRLARRAAGLVRAKVDSPMESRLRLLFVLAGLTEPVVNVEISDEVGRVRYRVDLSFPDHLLAFEFEGRQHVDVVDQWERDIVRREDLEAEGWRFVLVTSSALYGNPGDVLARIVAAMDDRGVPVPRRLRSEWRRFFVGSSDIR
jgi:hypothetical protein